MRIVANEIIFLELQCRAVHGQEIELPVTGLLLMRYGLLYPLAGLCAEIDGNGVHGDEHGLGVHAAHKAQQTLIAGNKSLRSRLFRLLNEIIRSDSQQNALRRELRRIPLRLCLREKGLRIGILCMERLSLLTFLQLSV